MQYSNSIVLNLYYFKHGLHSCLAQIQHFIFKKHIFAASFSVMRSNDVKAMQWRLCFSVWYIAHVSRIKSNTICVMFYLYSHQWDCFSLWHDMFFILNCCTACKVMNNVQGTILSSPLQNVELQNHTIYTGTAIGVRPSSLRRRVIF